MESDSISNAAAIADKENYIAKRVHTSKGYTPGKPKNKAPRIQDLVKLCFRVLENHQR